MRIKSAIVAALAVAALATSCKKDEEGDIVPPGQSAVSGLYINEVYSCNPDWVELYNDNDTEMDLSGFILQDEKGADEEYKMPDGTVIEAKSYLVVDAFSFGLSSSNGDAVTLLDMQRRIIDAVDLPAMEDGTSYGRQTDGSDSWKVFDVPTKGCDNDSEGVSGPESNLRLYINEVQTAPAGDDVDFIEIYNDEDYQVDISGFKLQDDKGAAEEFVIPDGTTIAAKGLLVFSQVSPGAGDSFTFGLSSKGDMVIFLDADGVVVDQVDTPDFGDVKGQSYARIGNGGAQWQILDTPTKGTANPSQSIVSYVGKIVINEVYTFSDQSSVDDLDFIELYNKTDEPIQLGGMKLWESGGPEEAWTIPAGKYIEPYGRLVIEADKEGLYADPVNYPSWGLSKGPGECVTLGDAQMNVIDYIALPSMNENESYGRKTDGDQTWQIFRQYTKGTANTGEARPEHTNTTGLFINEVYHDNQDEAVNGQAWTTTDFIELYNANDTELDISGWEIYDDKGDEAYVIPEGTVIQPRSFLTYDVFKENTDGPTFGLGVGGDWVFIYKPNKSELVDSVEIPEFAKDSGMRGQGYTYGRLTDGGDELVIFSEGSKNASNNGRAVLD